MAKLYQLYYFNNQKIECSSCKHKHQEEKPKIEEKKPEKQEKKIQKQQLVFWTIQLGTQKAFMNKIIKDFEKLHPDVSIKWIDVPYQENEKRIFASVLSNKTPDLVNVTSDFALLLGKKGALSEIEPSMLTSYSKPFVKLLQNKNGKCFAFPFYATSSVTIVNKKLFEQAKLKKMPQTYKDVFKMASRAKKQSGKYIISTVLVENDTFLKMLLKNDVNIASDEKDKNLLSNNSQDFYENFYNLYNKNLISKSSINQNHLEALEQFMSEESIMIVTGANFLNQIQENAPGVYKNCDVWPQLTGSNGRFDCSLMALAVPAKSKNKKMAKQFAIFLTNRQNQRALSKKFFVLPANKNVLKEIENESSFQSLRHKAQTISAFQVQNLNLRICFKHKKKVIEEVNSSVEKMLFAAKRKGQIKQILKQTQQNILTFEGQ